MGNPNIPRKEPEQKTEYDEEEVEILSSVWGTGPGLVRITQRLGDGRCMVTLFNRGKPSQKTVFKALCVRSDWNGVVSYWNQGNLVCVASRAKRLFDGVELPDSWSSFDEPD